MLSTHLGGAVLCLGLCAGLAADFKPAAQEFRQEIALHFAAQDGAPTGAVQLVECAPNGACRAFAGGQWHEFRDGRWSLGATLERVLQVSA
jgi:hypothetical protein